MTTILRKRAIPSLLSIVVPCYNEEESIAELRSQATSFINHCVYHCEIILVNDGSTDRTIESLVEWSFADSRVKVLNLSRNFGHQYASTAGIDYAQGDAVVLIDADLQDPFEVIHQMVENYCLGYDVVCGQRISRRGETTFKKFTAWFFYRLMRFVFLKRLPPDVGDFRLMSRRCIDSLRTMRELHRFLRGMVAWVGYSQTCVPYERCPRKFGETKYPLRKMIWLAWTAAMSFSALPLRVSFWGAGLMILLALEEAGRALRAFFTGNTVPGWTSLMVVLCLSSAATLTAVGILGEYVGRIFEEGKNRPLYLVADTWNIGESSSTSPFAVDAKVADRESAEV